MRTLVKAWGDSGGQPSAWAFLAVATSEAVVSGTAADLEPYIPHAARVGDAVLILVFGVSHRRERTARRGPMETAPGHDLIHVGRDGWTCAH
jgi:hypothetical protein